jgi:hypothetical protein
LGDLVGRHSRHSGELVNEVQGHVAPFGRIRRPAAEGRDHVGEDREPLRRLRTPLLIQLAEVVGQVEPPHPDSLIAGL